MAFGKILRPVFDPGLAVAPWWKVAGKTCVAAYQPKGAASLAASYVNLANPGTYDAAPGAAPTLTADGWSFDGSTQWLKTGVTPATDQTWSVLVRFSGQSGDNRNLIGGSSGYEFQILAQTSEILAVQRADTVFAVAASSNPGWGVAAMAGRNTYFNGVAGAIIGAGTGSVAQKLMIGQRSNYGENSPTGGVYMLGNIQAVAIYSSTLTAGEVATVSAAMAAL